MSCIDYDHTTLERIRPYRDEEVPEIVRTLLSDDEFNRLIKGLFPPMGEALLKKLPSIQSVYSFKFEIVAPVL